jgi:hypothetical protein
MREGSAVQRFTSRQLLCLNIFKMFDFHVLPTAEPAKPEKELLDGFAA